MTFRKAFGPYTVEQHSNPCRTGLLSHGDRGRSTEGWTPGCGQLQLPVGDRPGARDGGVGEGRQQHSHCPRQGTTWPRWGQSVLTEGTEGPTLDRDSHRLWLEALSARVSGFSWGPYPHTLVWPLSQQRVYHCVKSVREISSNYGRGSKCGVGGQWCCAHGCAARELSDGRACLPRRGWALSPHFPRRFGCSQMPGRPCDRPQPLSVQTRGGRLAWDTRPATCPGVGGRRDRAHLCPRHL